MPEALSKLQQRIVELWQNFDKSQKNRIYIISGLLVVAIAVAIMLLVKPNYMVLIRNADPKEVGEMTKILDTKAIKYSVSNDGSSITINAKDNNMAQAALVQQGYPKSTGLTFDDAFKMITITTTESEKQKIFQREEESNIAAKLKMLDNVDDASVTLAIPEQSLFVSADGNSQKPTASVMIKPKGDLTSKQVQGIIMMVARSVENLDPKDVTVVDSDMNILNSDTGDDIADSTNTQYEMTLKKKMEIEQNVRDIFNGQFDNFDSMRVVANPVLDFNKLSQQTQGIKNPDGMDAGALISNEKTSETLVNGTPGGVPGMGSNPGTATTTTPSYPTGSTGNSNYDTKTEKNNYDYTKYQTDEEKALGLLDVNKSSMLVTLLYGKRVADDTKMTQAFIDQFKQDMSAATGIPVANIAVNKYKIAPPDLVKVPLSETIKNLVDTYGFFALMLLLIIGLTIMAMPRKKPVTEGGMDFVPAEATAGGAATGPRFIVPEESEPLPEIEFEEKSEVKKQIEKFVKQKPEAVAQLLRNWISEEWD